MRTLLLILAWCLLLVLCWPIALAVLVLWPLLWLLSIPFRIVAVVVEAMLALLKAFLFFPARILRGRDTPVGSGRPIAVNVDPMESDLSHLDPPARLSVPFETARGGKDHRTLRKLSILRLPVRLSSDHLP